MWSWLAKLLTLPATKNGLLNNNGQSSVCGLHTCMLGLYWDLRDSWGDILLPDPEKPKSACKLKM